MKKLLLSFLTILLALPMGLIVPATAQAATISTNTAIRGTSVTTVYWYANDGKRYVFPNAQTYYSWFTSFDSVRTISDTELYSIALGGNVTYRPGAKLVKINTDPRVYAVARGGILRHVTSEYLAAQLYGADWRTDVHDIADVYFTNYTVGTSIYNAYDYNVSNEYNGVSNPSDSLRTSTGTGSIGDITLNTSRTNINAGEAVTLSVYNTSNYGSGYRIEIYDTRTNGLVRTCTLPTSVCETTVYPQRNTAGETSVQYYAALRDSASNTVKSGYSSVIRFDGSTINTQTGDLTIWADKTSIYSGDALTLSAWSSQTYNLSRIEIYDERDSSLVITCYSLQNCSQSKTIWRRGSETSVRFYAQLKDWNGVAVRTAYTPSITMNGGSTQTSYGENRINGLVLTADRTSINPNDLVRLTATAYHSGTWSYQGNRIEISNVNTGQILRTCYDSQTCTLDVYPQAQSSSNLTAQYQARIYDRNSVLAMSQYSPVIYLSGSNGSSGSYGTTVNGTGYITFAPSENLRVNRNLYLTSTFTGSNVALSDAKIEIFTEQSSTPLATCTGAYTCSVSYPTGSSPMTTRTYARLSNRNNVSQWVESPRVTLTTTW